MIRSTAVLAFALSVAMSAFAFQGSAQQPAPPQTGTMGQTPQQPAQPPSSQLPQSGSPNQPSQDQTPQTPQTPSQQQPSSDSAHNGAPSIDDQVKMLGASLQLNDDQQAKIKTILQDQHEQGMSIAHDPATSRDQKISKIHDLRQQTISKVRATLTTDDQRQRFDAMVQRQEERMRQMEQQQQQQKPETPHQ